MKDLLEVYFDEANQSKWREFWILKDEFSNRCLIRDGSEKYPDDVDGLPSKEWSHVIEIAALDLLRAELAAAKNEILSLKANAEADCSVLLRTEEKLRWLVKHSIDCAAISKAKGAELLGVPLIDMDEVLK